VFSSVREQLERKAAQQANAVWEKREDLASLKRKFPSLLNAKEDEELIYDKEKVRRPNPVEPTYVHSCCLRVLVLIHPCSRIVGLRIKSRDNKGDFVSLSAHHNAVVRPKECAATIIAQDDREMDRIKDRNHHWKDGIKVCLGLVTSY
jgi:enhancer of polycomb-like protein